MFRVKRTPLAWLLCIFNPTLRNHPSLVFGNTTLELSYSPSTSSYRIETGGRPQEPLLVQLLQHPEGGVELPLDPGVCQDGDVAPWPAAYDLEIELEGWLLGATGTLGGRITKGGKRRQYIEGWGVACTITRVARVEHCSSCVETRQEIS